MKYLFNLRNLTIKLQNRIQEKKIEKEKKKIKKNKVFYSVLKIIAFANDFGKIFLGQFLIKKFLRCIICNY